ncbi:hypothetical protein AB837_00258 [bacterium AB1]|nr:hypothetical protein AB837_00258 [bacterium AB1]
MILVLKLYSRCFVIKNNLEVKEKQDTQQNDISKNASFIIKECPQNFIEKALIWSNGLLFENNNPISVKVQLMVSKVLQKKVLSFKFKRRKRYKSQYNYKQKTAYMKVVSIEKV